jgi:hypothetical protein
MASLISPQAPVQSAAPVARRDSDGDSDGAAERTEAAGQQASERRAPLPASGAVGRSVDISA